MSPTRQMASARMTPGGCAPPPPRERPPVIADVLEPETYELAGGQGEVYGDTWNIQQLRRFYP
jgi:hypothetical protein